MKFTNNYIFLILFSLILCDSDIDNILNKSFNRLKNQDISFDCSLKIQSVSDEPVNLKFNFSSYWLDSLNFYSYLNFLSPIDFKNTEIWSHHSDDVTVRRRMPLNNKIITIEDELEGLDIIRFLKFDDMYAEIKKNEVSLKNSTYNKENVYVIKSYKKKNKRKVVKFFINKKDYSLMKVEWTNKRGILNKVLEFNDWQKIDKIRLSKSIIYEDIKKGTKTSCKLSNLSLKKLSNEKINLIKSGFEN